MSKCGVFPLLPHVVTSYEFSIAINYSICNVVCSEPRVRKENVKQSRNRPGVTQRVPGGLGSKIIMTFGTWMWWGCQPHAPVAFTPRKMFLVLIFTRGWVDTRAMVQSEGNMSPKDSVTAPGIDPGTVRLVAQRLKHYATPGPKYKKEHYAIYKKNTLSTLRNFVLVSYTCELWHRKKLHFRTHEFHSAFQSQLNFMGVTEECIVLDVRKYCVLCIVLGTCISFGVYCLRVYPPHLEYWQLPSYYVSVLLMKNIVIFWTCMKTSLRKSVTVLNKCFKVSDYCIQHSTSRHIF